MLWHSAACFGRHFSVCSPRIMVDRNIIKSPCAPALLDQSSSSITIHAHTISKNPSFLYSHRFHSQPPLPIVHPLYKMQFSTLSLGLSTLSTLSTILISTPGASALGINCRGSGLCDRASLSSGSGKIIQILRDAVWAANIDNSTTYNDGDHIICISQTDTVTLSGGADAEYGGASGSFELSGDVSFGAGGICKFTMLLYSNLHLFPLATLYLFPIHYLHSSISPSVPPTSWSCIHQNVLYAS